jgi:hypothetical protein
MLPSQDGHGITSLADLVPGDCVQVRDIVFERVRLLCGPLATAAGETLLCDAVDSHTLRVRLSAGRTFEIDRFYACFVAVDRLPSAGLIPPLAGAGLAGLSRQADA